jgi:hypothetical protein
MSAESGRRERQIAVERQLLAALCQRSLDDESREELLRRLEKHAFAMPDHEVVFRALTKLAMIKAQRMREALAATVTRMGFPDVDLNLFFEPPASAQENLADLLREL